MKFEQPINKFHFFLILFMFQTLNGISQSVIVLDSCTNHKYIIDKATAKDAYYISEWRNNHLIQKARFSIVYGKKKEKKSNKRSTYSLKSFFNYYDTTYSKSEFYNKFFGSNNIEEKEVYLDSHFNYNLAGQISKLRLFKDNKIIEKFNYNGIILVSHFKLINGIEHDTSFYHNGYKSKIRDSKGCLKQITRFENGKFNTLYLDPKRTFRMAPYINVEKGIYTNTENEYEEEAGNLEINKIDDDRYLVKSDNFYEGDIGNKQEIFVEKRSFWDPKGEPLFYNDKAYRCVEKRYFDNQNNLYLKKLYNKKGKLKTVTFKKFNYSTHRFNHIVFKNCTEFSIYSSKNRISYVSDSFKGTFYKKNNKWQGSDTFYVDKKKYISHLSFFETHYEFTSYLNGAFLIKGIIYENFKDKINIIKDSEEIDRIGNDFLNHLHYQFHYENMFYKEFDSLKIGNDSSLIIQYKNGIKHLIFTTFDERKTIFTQNNQELNLFKDQSQGTMGARNINGEQIIPPKFDKIENIHIYNGFHGYLCSVNDVACIVNNDGKTIIDYKKGLSKTQWVPSENFRKKHQLFLPILFICNDRKNDSFYLVSINDQIVMSGKGELSLLENKSLIIRNGNYNLLMNQDGDFCDDSSIAVSKISPKIYTLIIEDKVITEASLQFDKNTRRAGFPKKTYIYKYKIIDLEKGPLNGLEFKDFLYNNYNVKIFKKPGQTLILYTDGGYDIDTGNFNFIFESDQSFIKIKHYKLEGLLLPSYQKMIPPIYDEIATTNKLIIARRKHIIDVFHLDGNLEVSIPIKIDNPDKKYLCNKTNESSIYRIYKDRPIKLYKLKIGDHYGLYDEQGKEMMHPDFDMIQIEDNPTLTYFHNTNLMDLYDDEYIIKTLKTEHADIFVYRNNKLVPIQKKLVWRMNSTAHQFLIKPSGEIYRSDLRHEFNYGYLRYDLFSKTNQTLIAQLDLYGNEIYNSSDFLQVKTINDVRYVQLKNGKCGTLNCKNEFEIQPKYSALYYDKKHQLLWYKYGYKDELWKLKFLNLNKEVNDSFDFPIEIGNSTHLFIYSKNRKFGVMGLNAEILVAANYDHFAREEDEYNYLFSLNDRHFSWTFGMNSPVEQSYKNLYRVNDYNLNTGYLHSYIGLNGYQMFIVNSSFIAVDSSKDMFFRHVLYNNKASSVSRYSTDPFIINQKNNLKFINKSIQLTSSYYWSSLYPSSSFPDPHTTGIKYTQAIFNSSSILKEHIKFSNYTKLDYTHLKDKNMNVFYNGINTISFIDVYSNQFLNIYIDSLLGYLEFDLKDVFKGGGVDSLTEQIRSKWMKMDDPDLPCIEKEKIFKYFINQFNIHGEVFKFRLSAEKFISIPISELKPYMTEFWKKRF